jgi:branched-chain amino acid transport system ATP-binding protein
MLVVERLSKRFGGLTAVDGMSLTVPRGEICGVIGPNGAGKSTLFNLIAGELPPSDGNVALEGQPIGGLPSYRVARLGVARTFQLVHLFPSMGVAENVLVGARHYVRLGLLSALAYGGDRAAEARARDAAASAMAVVGVESLARRLVGELSVGQQRLVAVARALAAQPKLLLLDEPAAGLAQTESDALAGAVRRVRESGTTVLIVEHNVDLVMSLCDHVVVMHLGRKIADDAPEAVRRSEAVIEAYLGR